MRERRQAAFERSRERRLESERYNRRMTSPKTFLRRRILVGATIGLGLIGITQLLPDDPQPITFECCPTTEAPAIKTVPMLSPEQQQDRLEALLAEDAAQQTTTTIVVTTTTETPLASDPLDWIDEQRQLHGPCGEWHDLAIKVGWDPENIPMLLKIAYRESRCQPDAWNGADAGLVQINQIHTEWLGQMGFTHPDSMFDPELNLRFALSLFSSREEKGLCGWKPWSMPCDS